MSDLARMSPQEEIAQLREMLETMMHGFAGRELIEEHSQVCVRCNAAGIKWMQDAPEGKQDWTQDERIIRMRMEMCPPARTAVRHFDAAGRLYEGWVGVRKESHGTN